MSGSEDFGNDSSEESEDESDDDRSYDYGFMGDDDDEGDNEEGYEVDYSEMNVSPEILRMLGASEEVIAAKEEEISGIEWVAPTETGLEHSAAIASCDDVALGGEKDGQGSVQRVFNAVGTYDSPSTIKDVSSIGGEPALSPAEDAVLKVKITNAPEPVPKAMEFKLPPPAEAGDGSDSGSDTSWDEASVIDGHDWWEIGADEDVEDDTVMSPNLRAALGLANPSPDMSGSCGGGGKCDWQPPTFAGLHNSKPLLTLTSLAVGKEKGLEVKYRRFDSQNEGGGDTSTGGDEGEEWDSDEEGWDYEDVPDEDYIVDWSTNISPNLAQALGASQARRKSVALSHELSWKPPSASGLGNSSPLIDL